MSPRVIEVDAVLESLGTNPGRIDALMAPIPDDRRRARPRPDAWSAHEIFAHVRACADVWGGHITTILADAPERLPAGDPRAWAVDHGYLDAGFGGSFAAYADQRASLFEQLRGLSAVDWARSAVIVGASSRAERSVHWHAAHIVRHEDQHVTEIRRALKTVTSRS